jgi:hypothetical protein
VTCTREWCPNSTRVPGCLRRLLERVHPQCRPISLLACCSRQAATNAWDRYTQLLQAGIAEWKNEQKALDDPHFAVSHRRISGFPMTHEEGAVEVRHSQHFTLQTSIPRRGVRNVPLLVRSQRGGALGLEHNSCPVTSQSRILPHSPHSFQICSSTNCDRWVEKSSTLPFTHHLLRPQPPLVVVGERQVCGGHGSLDRSTGVPYTHAPAEIDRS